MHFPGAVRCTSLANYFSLITLWVVNESPALRPEGSSRLALPRHDPLQFACQLFFADHTLGGNGISRLDPEDSGRLALPRHGPLQLACQLFFADHTLGGNGYLTVYLLGDPRPLQHRVRQSFSPISFLTGNHEVSSEPERPCSPHGWEPSCVPLSSPQSKPAGTNPSFANRTLTGDLVLFRSPMHLATRQVGVQTLIFVLGKPTLLQAPRQGLLPTTLSQVA